MSTTIEPTPKAAPDLADSADNTDAVASKPVSPAPPAPTKRQRKRKWKTGFLKLVRRVHLYSGIFMFPFVLLYGISGWFFNHPRHLEGDKVTTFSADEVANGSLAKLPGPDVVAAEVVADLNRQSQTNDGPAIRLSEVRPAEFTGHLSFSFRGEEADQNLRLNPVTGAGEIRTTFKTEEEREEAQRNPIPKLRKAKIESNPFAHAKEAVPDVFKELGLPDGKLSESRRSTSVMFAIEVDGKPAMVSYNLGSGNVSALSDDARPEMETKSFLQRLHLSRTYAPHMNTRWFWALIVDGMVLSMVFWGVSGLIMWWQIKRTRLLGGGFLAASVICTLMLGIGMHDRLTTSSGLRSRRRSEPAQKTEPKESSRSAKASGAREASGNARSSGKTAAKSKTSR